MILFLMPSKYQSLPNLREEENLVENIKPFLFGDCNHIVCPSLVVFDCK